MQERVVTVKVAEGTVAIGAAVRRRIGSIVGMLIQKGVVGKDDAVSVRAIESQDVRKGAVGAQVGVTHVSRDADGNIDALDETYRIG